MDEILPFPSFPLGAPACATTLPSQSDPIGDRPLITVSDQDLQAAVTVIGLDAIEPEEIGLALRDLLLRYARLLAATAADNTDPPVDISAASRRIEAAFAILDDWPDAFHSLLSDVAHRFPPSQDRRRDKRAFASRIGKMLLYPPCDLSGRPLPPIYDEVFAFCRNRLGLKLYRRRHHTVDGLARR